MPRVIKARRRITNEYKESCSPDGRSFPAPSGRPDGYPWDCSDVIYVCYASPIPHGGFHNTQEAYEAGLSARYWFWDWDRQVWQYIGGAERFLIFRSCQCDLREYELPQISWPDPFPNHHRFARPDIYEVRPWAELIRRHFDQRLDVRDHDEVTDLDYGRTPREAD